MTIQLLISLLFRIARHEWHDIGLKKFKSLTKWYEEISKREAVQKGYDFLNQGDQIPKV